MCEGAELEFKERCPKCQRGVCPCPPYSLTLCLICKMTALPGVPVKVEEQGRQSTQLDTYSALGKQALTHPAVPQLPAHHCLYILLRKREN